MTMQNITG